MYNADVVSAELELRLGDAVETVRIPFTYSADTFEEVSVALHVGASVDRLELVPGEVAPVVRGVHIEPVIHDGDRA